MSSVSYKGPLFDGRAVKIFHDYAKDAEKDIAEEALSGLKRHFHTYFKHPTGNYESNVHIASGGKGIQINDRGIVYGPWLEGISAKNRTTKFRGYYSFEETAFEMDKQAGNIAERTFRTKWLRKLD